MQLGFDVQIPDGLLAANALLAENSRQGFATGNRAPYQGLNRANCTAALGLSWSVASATCSTHLMGRFMSPDWSAKEEPVPYAKLDNPQSLNLYAYVLNNPLSRVDADGHDDKTPEKIVAAAKASKDSQSYDINRPNVSNGQFFKPGNDKCNEYVSDTVKSADGVRPVVQDTGKIPTAAQFADSKVTITGLSEPKPMSEAKPGDVLAQNHGANANGNQEGHVGIIIALPHDGQKGQTASANANEGGKVTINDWGFRSPTANPNNGERNGAASPPPVVRHPL